MPVVVYVRRGQEIIRFAAEYLRAAREDTDEPGVLLIALRRVAEARGGIAKSSPSGRHRTRKPVPRPIGARKSPSAHLSRGNQGSRTETHCGSRSIVRS